MKRALLVGACAAVFAAAGLADVALAKLSHHEAQWIHRNDWWRGRPEWRGYSGERSGYAFAPGYGYYHYDRGNSAGRGWRRGQYAPPELRTRYVRDPAFFGVRPAPRGYAWIWCGRDILLVSVETGLVLDVVHNVY